MGRDAVNGALLNELLLLKAAAAGRPALPAPEENAAEVDATEGLSSRWTGWLRRSRPSTWRET